MAVDRPGPATRTELAAVATFRADGERLATSGPNGDLKIWDTKDSRQPVLLSRVTGRHRIVGASWNPVATDLLATLSTDNCVTIWRLVHYDSPRELFKLRSPPGHSGSIVWLHDGRHITLASDDGSVIIWNIVSRVSRIEVVGNPSGCRSVFSDRENVLHIVYGDGSIRQAALSARFRPAWARRLPRISSAAWSATGAFLAIAGHDHKIEIRGPHLHLVRDVGLVTSDVPLITWHQDSEVILIERNARRMTILDRSGQILAEKHLPVTPTSVSAANGVVAIGCCGFSPVIMRI